MFAVVAFGLEAGVARIPSLDEVVGLALVAPWRHSRHPATRAAIKRAAWPLTTDQTLLEGGGCVKPSPPRVLEGV